MIIKVEKDSFTQRCGHCKKLHKVLYSEIAITSGFIKLEACDQCGSLEVLHNNNGDDDHSIMVTKVFAKVATQ